MKKAGFALEKKALDKAGLSGIKKKDHVYIKTLDGPRWWCIGQAGPQIDASCKEGDDGEAPQTEYEVPPSAVSNNWIDTPGEEEHPPFLNWETPRVEAIIEPPRVTTHVLHSKDKLLLQLCIVIGQLANEEHYRTLFLYTPVEHASETRGNKHTVDCLLFMFHQVIGIGDDLTEVSFHKQNHQAPLSKVVFAMKQLCANDTEQKKNIGRSIIVPLVRCWHACHPAKDKLLTEFVFQSFSLLQMLSAVWENMQLLLNVRRGKPEDANDLDLKKGANNNFAIEALKRIRSADFLNSSVGQESWAARIDMTIADVNAVLCRLQQS